MSKKKLKVGVLFGGKSAEHEVSLQSARNVINALDKEKYDVVPIGINKSGKWMLADKANYLLNASNPKLIKLNSSSKEVAVYAESAGALTDPRSGEAREKIDAIIPVLHGPFGEDGSIQGLLKVAGIPFVGASVLGSAVGMDKDVMKRLLRDAGIPIPKFLTFKKGDKISHREITKKLGKIIFLKPANLGSSVGVNKVKNEKEWKRALREAFEYDSKVMAEEAIIGREIECSVLGNENPVASIVGEVVLNAEFYSYEAKYIDENGAVIEIPAKNISKTKLKEIQDIAIKVFKTLNCEGLGRVDMFLTKAGKIYVNEINTIPGFTNISMYPKLWEASGLSQTKLLDKLIDLAVDRFRKEQKLKTTFN